MALEIGATASRTKTITDQDIRSFADIVDDHNPVHMDEAFAATTTFKKRIAHGMLGASVISAALANDLPGPGTVYLGQDLKFKAPVFIGDTITATVTCTALRRKIATFKTVVTNQDGTVVIEGEATVIAPA